MKSFSTGGREEDPSVQGHVAASASLLPSPRPSNAATQACVCLVPLVLSLLLLAWAQVKHAAVPWLLPAATAVSRRSQTREMPEPRSLLSGLPSAPFVSGLWRWESFSSSCLISDLTRLPHSSAGVQLFGPLGMESRLCPAPSLSCDRLSRVLPPALALSTHRPAPAPISPPWAPRPDCVCPVCPGSFPSSPPRFSPCRVPALRTIQLILLRNSRTRRMPKANIC